MKASDSVRRSLDSYFARHDLDAAIEVLSAAEEDGNLELKISNRAAGSASVTVLVAPFEDDRYGIYIFIGEDQSPIEIEGPLNIGRAECRPALEDLADVMDSVLAGEVYEEFDEDGDFVACGIWDPERSDDESDGVRRRMFKAWT
ncbi:hypothetical protein SAMN06272739_1917 [Blastococcus haudaquaticus]|uniref:Uncharacterized protein n=2 Tax=Blastococcus haudaquaticus TaxID=1938745 RepID=A0A286GTE6_9ACTN|nr:hypothetical protein SAMN06272739_1917 [Blastococcus haudaquaticus]